MDKFSLFGMRALLFIIASSHAGSAIALIVKLSDLHSMANKSDVVLHGIVGDQVVTMDEIGRPVTYSYMEVIDSLHGSRTGEVVTIYQVGGELDGMVMPIIGGQRYQIGQEVILFALKLGDAFVSYGAGQGKFDIIKESDQEIVLEDLGDISAVAQNSKSGNHLYTPMPLRYQDKEEFKKEIRLMLNK